MATDRVTPVGISAVNEDVSRFECLCQSVEGLIHFRPRRNVEENGSWCAKMLAKVRKGANLNETRLDEVSRGSMPGMATRFCSRLSLSAATSPPGPAPKMMTSKR